MLGMKTLSLVLLFGFISNSLCVECPTGWIRFFGRKCIWVGNETMAFKDSQEQCEKLGAKLFIPRSPAENYCAKSLFRLMPSGGSYYRLDGAGDADGMWHTTDGLTLNGRFYQPYINMRSDLRATVSSAPYCLIMQNDVWWSYSACYKQTNIFHICEKILKREDRVSPQLKEMLINMTKTDRSPTLAQLTGNKEDILKDMEHYTLKYEAKDGPRDVKELEVINKPMTFNDAHALCKSIGGKMLEIQSAEENEFFEKNSEEESHWIDAIKPLPESGKFVNMNAQELPFDLDVHSVDIQPPVEKTCLTIKGGAWIEIGCARTANVICEMQEQQVIPGFQEYETVIEKLGRVPRILTRLDKNVALVQILLLKELEDQKELVSEIDRGTCHFM